MANNHLKPLTHNMALIHWKTTFEYHFKPIGIKWNTPIETNWDNSHLETISNGLHISKLQLNSISHQLEPNGIHQLGPIGPVPFGNHFKWSLHTITTHLKPFDTLEPIRKPKWFQMFPNGFFYWVVSKGGVFGCVLEGISGSHFR